MADVLTDAKTGVRLQTVSAGESYVTLCLDLPPDPTRARRVGAAGPDLVLTQVRDRCRGLGAVLRFGRIAPQVVAAEARAAEAARAVKRLQGERLLLESDPPEDVLAALRAADEKIAAAEAARAAAEADAAKLRGMAAPAWIDAAREVAGVPLSVRNALVEQAQTRVRDAREALLAAVAPHLDRVAVAERRLTGLFHSFDDPTPAMVARGESIGSPPPGVGVANGRYFLETVPSGPPPGAATSGSPSAPAPPVLVNTVRQIR